MRVSVLLGEFFRLLHALGARRTDKHDFSSQRGRAVHLDLGRVARHHNHRLHSHRARRVGDSLGMIAAGVRDHAALSLLLGKRSDLVVGAPSLNEPIGCRLSGLK